MKSYLTLFVTAALLFSGVSVAQAAEKTEQQQKMALCNQHASSQNLKGDARKSFMSDCLKKDSKLSGMTPQQMKMKTCNSEAGDKKLSGDARKTFMSSCLKKA
ncbi:phosphate starvation-inducible protein [Candidatus Pantoea deserta]|uniref:Phosphate starvation-inducible protein n=1 Tax=Candidatus Pantoea deserta TaxID=1869313 RepID=A0A3N4P4F0_9GAMM|nr:PsiF family protein [Pantoea deserta]RPE03522.1 phosphate starvation-inducible protein [Pantoea deserta]